MSNRRPKKKVLVKIIIIGESGVGKTALLHQYVMGKFIQEHKATIGADFLTKEIQIEDKVVTLQIWDTAGQERFQSLGNAFYRGADACIMVYDISDERTFKQIEEWKNKFISQAAIDQPRNYPFLLLGNKCDLTQQRVVTLNEGEAYSRDNNMEFFETSAVDGKNINNAIEEIASIASDQDTVPFFTEELVERIQIENNGQNPNEMYQQNGGGCACLLL